MTTGDVAKLLNVCSKTVVRLIEAGLPGYMLPIRGGWRFRRDEVRAWLERQRLED